MAVGDVVSNITTVVLGSSLSFQPAVGIEYLILKAGSNKVLGSSPNISYLASAQIYNGTIFSYISRREYNPMLWIQWKIYITNARYFRMINEFVGLAIFSIIGIQTK